MTTHRRAILLGPQRSTPNLADAVASLNVEGPAATITAGWEEREAEDQELIEHLARPTRNLGLFPRSEDVLRRDPELLAARRRMHDSVRRLKEAYRLRLGALMDLARDLLARVESADDESSELWSTEAEEVVQELRALDAGHLARVDEVQAAFEEEVRPQERDALAQHRRELAQILDGSALVCVAGGHVGALLEALRLFDVPSLLGEQPLVGWSGGAMVLTERVVLFHDSPPQGPGNAEVLDRGLGLAPGLVALPHAERRLRLTDRTRVSLFARRFGPARCVALETGDGMEFGASGSWRAFEGTRRLALDGELVGAGQ